MADAMQTPPRKNQENEIKGTPARPKTRRGGINHTRTPFGDLQTQPLERNPGHMSPTARLKRQGLMQEGPTAATSTPKKPTRSTIPKPHMSPVDRLKAEGQTARSTPPASPTRTSGIMEKLEAAAETASPLRSLAATPHSPEAPSTPPIKTRYATRGLFPVTPEQHRIQVAVAGGISAISEQDFAALPKEALTEIAMGIPTTIEYEEMFERKLKKPGGPFPAIPEIIDTQKRIGNLILETKFYEHHIRHLEDNLNKLHSTTIDQHTQESIKSIKNEILACNKTIAEKKLQKKSLRITQREILPHFLHHIAISLQQYIQQVKKITKYYAGQDTHMLHPDQEVARYQQFPWVLIGFQKAAQSLIAITRDALQKKHIKDITKFVILSLLGADDSNLIGTNYENLSLIKHLETSLGLTYEHLTSLGNIFKLNNCYFVKYQVSTRDLDNASLPIEQPKSSMNRYSRLNEEDVMPSPVEQTPSHGHEEPNHNHLDSELKHTEFDCQPKTNSQYNREHEELPTSTLRR